MINDSLLNLVYNTVPLIITTNFLFSTTLNNAQKCHILWAKNMLWKMQVKNSDCFFFHICLQIECKEMGRIGLSIHVFHFWVQIVKKVLIFEEITARIYCLDLMLLLHLKIAMHLCTTYLSKCFSDLTSSTSKLNT